ncbi:MAG: hypothetical protein OXC07_03535 [Kistimonas sp.]|nr:hypothetical protein [Kistimonas sp.]
MQVKKSDTALPHESPANRVPEATEGKAASKVMLSPEPVVRQTPGRDAMADAEAASDQPRPKVLNAWDVRRVAVREARQVEQARPSESFADVSLNQSSLSQVQQARHLENQLLAAHVDNQPGMQELAREVARLQEPLRKATRVVEEFSASADKDKGARQALDKALADVKRATGLRYEECLSRKQELDSKRAAYLKPALADLEKELQVHRVALHHVRNGLEFYSARIHKNKAELDTMTRNLEDLRKELDKCERELDYWPSHSCAFTYYSREKNCLNERLFQLLKKQKGEQVAQRLASLELDHQRESLIKDQLLAQEQQLLAKRRVLKQLIGGFETQQQMEQAGQLYACQDVLGSLVKSLEETQQVLARHQRTIESDWSFEKVLKICPSLIGAFRHYIRKRALKARIAHEVAAMRRLSSQLDVDPASLWVRIGKDGTLSLSERTVARTSQGPLLNPLSSLFNDSSEPTHASSGQLRGEVETLVRELRRTAGQNLEYDSPPAAPPCGDEIDVGLIKSEAGHVDLYREELQKAVLNKYYYGQPGVRELSECIGMLIDKGRELARAGRAGNQEQAAALADEMTNSLPRLRDLFAALKNTDLQVENLDGRVKNLEKMLRAIREGSGRPDALQSAITTFGYTMDALKGRLLLSRLQEVRRRLENRGDDWAPRQQGRTREERVLNAPRTLLKDEERVLKQLISGFTTYGDTVLAARVTEAQHTTALELRKNLERELEITRLRSQGARKLRSFRLPGALADYKAAGDLAMSVSGANEYNNNHFYSGYRPDQALGVDPDLGMVKKGKAGEPVLTEIALAMFRAGVVELFPVYRRRHDTTISMHYKARVEKNGAWIDQDQLKEWLEKRAAGEGPEAQAARDALAAQEAHKKASARS